MLELNQCYNMDCMKGMAQFPDGFFDLAVFQRAGTPGLLRQQG